MASLNVSAEELSCPVCYEIFKAPVILSCSHSVCKECLQQFWKTKTTQECPVCRRRSSKEYPPINQVLKNLCESIPKERNETCSSESEEICSLHSEKLKLFCLEDKQPVCVVCFTSQKHTSHTIRPIGEVVSSYKEELNTALKSLQEQLQHNENIKGEFEKTAQHIKSQAEQTESQIKQQFEKLHQVLRDEEEATITALREEEEQKKQMMKEKLEEMNTHISTLSQTIKDIEETMRASDICFLKEFPVSKERVQSSKPDPQMASGALINVPRYLGNLPSRVWKEMQDIVQNSLSSDTSTSSVFEQQPSSAGVFGQAESGVGLFASNAGSASSGSAFLGGLGGQPSEDAANRNPFGVPAAQGFGQAINTGSSNLFGSSGANDLRFATLFGQKPGSSLSTGAGSLAPQGFSSFSTHNKPVSFTFGGSPGEALEFGTPLSFSSALSGPTASNVRGFFGSPSNAQSFGNLANPGSAASLLRSQAQQPSGFGSQTGFNSSGAHTRTHTLVRRRFGRFGSTHQ